MGGISLEGPSQQPAPAAPSTKRWGSPPMLIGLDGKMHRHPGRSGAAWERCKKIVKARDTVCHMCGLPLNPYARKSPDSTECDHYPVTLAMMEAQGLPPAEVRRLSTDPSNVKAVHRSCHQGAGPPRTARRPQGEPSTTSRRWLP
jgi:hypothetical protein